MIIGNGNIAKVLIDRPDVVFFAAGCSNSACTEDAEFEREKDLIMMVPPEAHVVYFSNLAIYPGRFKGNAYIDHKKKMEQLIKDRFVSYTIIRMEVCTWVQNPTTILNVFRRKIAANEPVDIQDTVRSVINLDEFLYWVNCIPVGQRNEMNITGQLMKVKDIYEQVKAGTLI